MSRSSLRDRLGERLREAVRDRVTPGAIAAIWEGDEELLTVCAGTLDGHLPVEPDTVYDVASVTKAVSTASLLAELVAAGRIDLEAPARALLSELVAPGTELVTIAHLAGHAAGLPDHVELFRRLEAGERAGAMSPRAALTAMAGQTPLLYRPGDRSLYSDLGYILLGAALERAGGARLDALFSRHIAAPLGLRSSIFFDLENESAPDEGRRRIAPTEERPSGGRLRGEVHDENARAAGGICGHAGLFSVADDLCRLGVAVGAAQRGEKGVLSPEGVQLLLGTSAAANSTWRLGWDRPDPRPGVSHAGEGWPRDGFGHLGYTGTSLWLDPPRGRCALLLTNRVFYTRDPAPIRALRRDIMNAISGALG